jgi:hypothetical protein
MSFGWSAGDVATAIALTYKLIQVLDTCDGAAGDYRGGVSFLRDLTRSLEPLQTFTSCNANPIYGREIEEQVECIKKPVEDFLAAVLKYEPSLGPAAKVGHHQHIVRKLQWTMSMSKKVLGLRKKIESHMRIIDTLMQRLTLYVALQILVLMRLLISTVMPCWRLSSNYLTSCNLLFNKQFDQSSSLYYKTTWHL